MKNKNRSRKKLIKYIMHICDVELSKSIEEIDVDLISQCVSFCWNLRVKLYH